MPTLNDVAKASGVSPAVVSRVVNGDKSLRISDETRERVLNAIAQMGYTPNRAARSLRSAETGLIALVLHDVANPVYAEITRGAQSAAAAAGKAILISDGASGSEGTARMVELIGGRGVDGLILQGSRSASDLILARAAKEHLPTALLQARLGIDAPVIALPDERAGWLGTRHLIELGHKRIGLLGTAAGLSFTADRMAGWRNALLAAGLEAPDSRTAFTPPTIDDGRAAAAAILNRDTGVTALLCCNVVSAIGALAEIQSRGLAVPADFSLVAIHDIPLAAHLSVAMTTISMPLFQLGQQAVNTVVDPHRGIETGTIVVADEPQLIVRKSTQAR